MRFRTKPWLMAALIAALPVAAPAQPVDTPGVTSASLDRLQYRHRRRPLHPFER